MPRRNGTANPTAPATPPGRARPAAKASAKVTLHPWRSQPSGQAKGAEGRRELLAWYDAHRRDLPWRRDTDPYRVLVSEAMLQQTRIDVALPYYEGWMERFPTLQALADAPVDDVLEAWAGLGYYQRARRLHECARLLLVTGWPTTEQGLRELPGFGPYTAAAVASIAFNEPVAAVDGNVQRVLARRHAIGDPTAIGTNAAAARRHLAGLAQAWLDPDRPGDWNQAVMDLGATVCTPRSPRCDACPVSAGCAARAQGNPEAFPAPRTRAAPAPVQRVHVAVVRRPAADRAAGAGNPASRDILLVRRAADGLLAGMWALPTATSGAALRRSVPGARSWRGPATARHVFSHRVWDMRVHVVDAAGPLTSDMAGETRWVREADLGRAGLPSAMRKALAAAEGL